MVYLKTIQKITPMDVSVSGTINQKTYLKNFGGASAPLVPPWIRLWWAIRGTCSPHFFRRGGHDMLCTPHIFLFRFCIWRGCKNRSDICHVSY